MIKTILIVEDEAPLLAMLKEILATDNSWQLLCAASATEGLEIGLAFAGGIALLLANVILNGTLGTALATKLKCVQPGMRVILIDGKAAGDLKMLHSGWQVLPKPHTGAILLERVRAELAVGSATAKG